MNSITEKIENLHTLLEAAINEHSWELVREVMEELDCLYQDLERGDLFECEY